VARSYCIIWRDWSEQSAGLLVTTIITSVLIAISLSQISVWYRRTTEHTLHITFTSWMHWERTRSLSSLSSLSNLWNLCSMNSSGLMTTRLTARCACTSASFYLLSQQTSISISTYSTNGHSRSHSHPSSYGKSPT
jgi:hypothetical protein